MAAPSDQPTPSDQLRQVVEYVKFHLGIYLATPAALAVLAESLGIQNERYWQYGLMAFSATCLISGFFAAQFLGNFSNLRWVRPTASPAWGTIDLRELEAFSVSYARRFFHHWLYWCGLLFAVVVLVVVWCTKRPV